MVMGSLLSPLSPLRVLPLSINRSELAVSLLRADVGAALRTLVHSRRVNLRGVEHAIRRASALTDQHVDIHVLHD